MTLEQFVTVVKKLLLTNEGEVITPKVADERARNIVSSLSLYLTVTKEKTISVRFTKDGCGYNPNTKEKLSRHTNIIYHPVFWDVSVTWVNNVCKEHSCKMVRVD